MRVRGWAGAMAMAAAAGCSSSVVLEARSKAAKTTSAGSGGATSSAGSGQGGANSTGATSGGDDGTTSGAITSGSGACGYEPGGSACFADPPPFDKQTYFYRCVMYGPGSISLAGSCTGSSCHGSWGAPCQEYASMLKYITKDPAQSPLITVPSSPEHAGGNSWMVAMLEPLLATSKQWLAQEAKGLP
jgi:hypothetical protein